MAVMEPTQIDQFQIGDEVFYEPEQVITTVIGYVWREQMGSLPRIALYTLACGISAPKDALKACVSDWLLPARQHHTLPPQRTPVDAIGKDRMPSYTYPGPRCGRD